MWSSIGPVMKMMRSFRSRGKNIVGALATVCLLDHHGNELAHIGFNGIFHIRLLHANYWG